MFRDHGNSKVLLTDQRMDWHGLVPETLACLKKHCHRNVRNHHFFYFFGAALSHLVILWNKKYQLEIKPWEVREVPNCGGVGVNSPWLISIMMLLASWYHDSRKLNLSIWWWLMLIEADWWWFMLIDALMLRDVDWCRLVLIGVDWCYFKLLVLIANSCWCCLMLVSLKPIFGLVQCL